MAAWRWREGFLLAKVFVFSVDFASAGLVLLAALIAAAFLSALASEFRPVVLSAATVLAAIAAVLLVGIALAGSRLRRVLSLAGLVPVSAAAVPALGLRWTWHADRLRQFAPTKGSFSRIAIRRLVPMALGAAGVHHTGEPPR